MKRALLWGLAGVLLVVGGGAVSVRTQAVIDYPIVYVAVPNPGRFADSFTPVNLTAGSDLRLRWPNGDVETLYDAGTDGAVADPTVSLDGESVYFSFCPNVSVLRGDITNTPAEGCDIYVINVDTRVVTQLTDQEQEPNTALEVLGAIASFPVYNMGPREIVTGDGLRLAWTTNRRNFYPPHGFGQITPQIAVGHIDGTKSEIINPMTIGGALHPYQLTNGDVCWSSKESQGMRDRRVWSIWCNKPDGRTWYPLVSALMSDSVFHFMAQRSDGRIVYEDYYNLNNSGFGAFFEIPTSNFSLPIQFGSADAFDGNNPELHYTDTCGRDAFQKYSFSRIGVYALTPFATPHDESAGLVNEADCVSPTLLTAPRLGKVTTPAAGPDGDLLISYSDGPVILLPRPVDTPHLQAGIWVRHGYGIIERPEDMDLVVDDPLVSEIQPAALVSYLDIYGIATPTAIPYLPNDGTENDDLPPGTPYGIIGTSSVCKRESFPGNARSANYLGSGITNEGLEPFNAAGEYVSSNFGTQGADTRIFDCEEIHAMRIFLMEPKDQVHPDWFNWSDERLRVLGEIELKKSDGMGGWILDNDGNPDTSFWAKIPADTPVTFQLLDERGLALTTAQTWHQVRPGEVRVDCGGCHAHSQLPLNFNTTESWTTPATDLTLMPAHEVEFRRDIEPILESTCQACHTGPWESAPGLLTLDDGGFGIGQAAWNYFRLANDKDALEGRDPVGYPNTWVWNASAYTRPFNSSRSLLMWTLFEERLDGFTNEQFPGTAPPGVDQTNFDRFMTDLNYVAGTVDHSGMLTLAQKKMFAKWIDTTMLTSSNANDGALRDANRPVITLKNHEGTGIVGFADGYSGINAGTLAVSVEGVPATLTSLGAGRWSFALPSSGPVEVTASGEDNQGNLSVLVKELEAGSGAPPDPPTTRPPVARFRIRIR